MAPESSWTEVEADRLRAAVGDFVRRVRSVDSMSSGRVAVLGHLNRSGSLSIAELAALERLRHQSMQQTVAHLQEQRLIKCERDKRDGRRILCSLTQQGAVALATDRARRNSWIVLAANSALSERERASARAIPGILAKLQLGPDEELSI